MSAERQTSKSSPQLYFIIRNYICRRLNSSEEKRFFSGHRVFLNTVHKHCEKCWNSFICKHYSPKSEPTFHATAFRVGKFLENNYFRIFFKGSKCWLLRRSGCSLKILSQLHNEFPTFSEHAGSLPCSQRTAIKVTLSYELSSFCFPWLDHSMICEHFHVY
jgi:hypothetical protein